MSVLTVAHRAGNALPALRAAAEAGVDVVELDVHLTRERLEVRHSKRLGPLPLLWDRQPWELTSRRLPQLQLEAVLEALPPGPGLMLDLKGVTRVGPQVVRALAARRPERPVLVCSRWWPSVAAAAGEDWALPVLSCRNRAELARLLRHVRAGGRPHGISLHGSLLSAPVVAELRDRVERVLTWGVDDEASLDRVLGLGVNGVISDELDVLRTLLAQR